jgi:hypothetical protein
MKESNTKYQIPNIKSMPNVKNLKYDLEERRRSTGPERDGDAHAPALEQV